VFGGVNINPQIQRLKLGVDILVATPGRLLDHVSQRTVNLSAGEFLVLDEADRMLDMGFIRDIRRILALLPRQRQNLLFSATYSEEMRKFADSLLSSPEHIEVARRNTPAELVSQVIHPVDRERKFTKEAHKNGMRFYRLGVITEQGRTAADGKDTIDLSTLKIEARGFDNTRQYLRALTNWISRQMPPNPAFCEDSSPEPSDAVKQ